ncbi:uncharacterized protein N7459_000520 [Penicillium hispanicum]|uniref:uncharacterized protein n=1 Tax=Penicillium hispanicum TaxID=1080232 RepID=UPI00253FE07E|nr:uncharacterized protein N7459_000520 [Penicillium hispanicum]KAJ5594312.1 hypothetical protein N7459_000520 [Penicillium hispanicum]
MRPSNTMNNQRPRFGPSLLPDRTNYGHVDMNQNHSTTLSRSSRMFSGSVTGSSFTTDEPGLQDPSSSSQFEGCDQGSHEDSTAPEAPILTQLGSWHMLENELPGTLDLGDGHNPNQPPPSDESAMNLIAQSLGARSMPPHLKEMFNALSRLQDTYQLIGSGQEPTQDLLILSRQLAHSIEEDLTSRIRLENKPSSEILSEAPAADGPFCCSLCPRGAKYKSRHTLIRHFHEKHSHRWCYHCPERCGYSAYRRDKTQNHVVKKHLRSPGADELDKNRDGLELPPVCSVCKAIPRAWETMEKCYIDSCRMPSTSSDGSSQQGGHGYGAGPRHPRSSTLAFSTPLARGSKICDDENLYDSDMDLSQVGVSFHEVENDQMDTSMDAPMHTPAGNSTRVFQPLIVATRIPHSTTVMIIIQEDIDVMNVFEDTIMNSANKNSLGILPT